MILSPILAKDNAPRMEERTKYSFLNRFEEVLLVKALEGCEEKIDSNEYKVNWAKYHYL
ncbi:hypothetical protein GCM10007049_39410 [Echinicola pacifica]|uniref:Uncharacterized protein n=1 Tax=Echinicola pacifica TaxID=346377 RepID=A0A918QFH0_9BACT|nr:hypothetical protein GCM10007049_39410 [Echinicola pacifica]